MKGNADRCPLSLWLMLIKLLIAIIGVWCHGC